MNFFFVSFFDIRKVPRGPGKWNWDRLSFLPFISSFEHCGGDERTREPEISPLKHGYMNHDPALLFGHYLQKQKLMSRKPLKSQPI